MADLPGGGGGLLVREYKGKKADRLVTRSDPGVVPLVAELGGQERQAAEELGQWKTCVEERKTLRSEPGGDHAGFSELIGGVQDELKLHRVYAAELGIDLERVTPNAACRAYTDFLMRTAWHGSLAETVAALVPCMSLYAFLGKELAPKCGPLHPYRKWIETYRSGEFAQLANRLESMLDRVGSDAKEIRDAYRYALECEINFFSSSLEL